jgi:UDP-N-acetylmuramoyl-L-alanyl-D-glutamate--2,6-diaminopimelate ligase
MVALPLLVPELENVDIQVSGIRDDSRRVVQGDLFIAVSGGSYTAQQMLEDIQTSGAAAALYDASENVDGSELSGVPLFSVENLRQKRGHIASRFYGKPSESMYVVGVTGTNGKTSCTQYLSAALAEKTGVVGTMGWGFAPDLQEPGLTTPDAIRLQELFARLLEEDAAAICIEASSHGLDQERLSGIAMDVAVLTNLTRDHLDYHGSVEAYKAAKKRLFLEFPIKLAVLNHDDAFSPEIARELSDDVKVLRYSLRNSKAEIYCSSLDFSNHGIEALVETPWGPVQLRSQLIGDFNASNLLAVIAVLASLGYSPERIAERVEGLSNVKGRMDRMDLKNGVLAVIDYAHTPDALENALKALRVHCQGKLWCVMGCGGDRDQGKRPLMGEIANRLADGVVVTDDNPRTEKSEKIIDQIIAGIDDATNVIAIRDRKLAIEHALAQANPNDIVLIAGKGHENYQEIDGIKHPFSDHQVVVEFEVAASRQVIVGLGVTGQAAVRYCAQRNLPFVVVEDRPNDALVANLTAEIGSFECFKLSDVRFETTDRVLLSPGVPASLPELISAAEAGIAFSNDIQVFADHCQTPLCLITGSNGKSTVTSFVGQLISQAGIAAEIGGNIGIPALDLLDHEADMFVLEVSSYQLEIATNCRARVAALLNLSPDHLDRYDSLEDYYQTKTHIFSRAEVAIYDRSISFDLGIPGHCQHVTFGVDEPKDGHYGLRTVDGEQFIVRGHNNLIAAANLPMQGEFDLLNLQATLAICEAMGGDLDKLLSGLPALERLPHRYEILDDISAHLVINDSKSTNPASTSAALSNLSGEKRPVNLILGGLAKEADFSGLDQQLNKVDRCLAFGADRNIIRDQLGTAVEVLETLSDCIEALELHDSDPSVVLFSPACASQDQYRNYAERGDAFKQEMRELLL